MTLFANETIESSEGHFKDVLFVRNSPILCHILKNIVCFRLQEIETTKIKWEETRGGVESFIESCGRGSLDMKCMLLGVTLNANRKRVVFIEKLFN